ncbi:MAG: FGGY family carbohydrate kinase [Dehalococcoidales bacterium]|nr:FGGY family carbohydrate kinase [Dehalococcoidales bacterium]
MGVLSIDIGTSGNKTILFSETGEAIASAYMEYAHVYPRPGWVEVDPELIWAAVQKTVSEIGRKHKNQITAISISSMGRNIIPVNKDGKTVHRAILAADTRANEEAALIKNTIGEKQYYQIRGNRPSVAGGLSKILWLKKNASDVFNQTWKFMTFPDYILMRMGLKPALDYSMAATSTPFDLRKKEYSEAILKEFGLTGQIFSEPVPSGTVVGEIGAEMRARLGLPTGVKMVSGGHDVPCGILGAGVTHLTPGVMADITGFFEGPAFISAEPIFSQEAYDTKARVYNGVLKDTYTVLHWLPTGGYLVRWFRNEFAIEERVRAEKEYSNVYDIMFAPLKFDGGTIMIVPYFSGSDVDGYAKGAVLGLTMATTRQELLKGIVEGVTHELKLLTDRLERVSKGDFQTVRAFGGHTKSPKWLQLKADVLGKEVEAVQIEDASALGAGLLAGLATGVWGSVEEALKATVKFKGTYKPRPEFHRIYERQHKVYEQIVNALTTLNVDIFKL